MPNYLKFLATHDREEIPRTADGYPIRGGHRPLMKDDEYENIEISLDANVRVFATDNVEDMKAYTDVLDKVANGLFVRLAPDKEEFLRDRYCWLILVRWAEVKGDIDPKLIKMAQGMA